jgi:NAD+ kinase
MPLPTPSPTPDRGGPTASPAKSLRVGVVVHPSRNIDQPLRDLLEWTGGRDDEVVQIPIPGQDREVAAAGNAADCDLLVSVGGDGTMLAAIRAAVPARRPVLGVACGSLGALTAVPPGGVANALDRFSRGDWYSRSLPALQIARADHAKLFAINDVVVARAGIGQVLTTIRVDGTLYARLAGDGCIVSTQVGSSAYTIAARGPLLAPGTNAYTLTPLPTHGGSCPPLVVAADSELELEVQAGFGGARLEIDGQIEGEHAGALTVGLRSDVAALVYFDDQEPQLTGLRRRRVIVDSPRFLADDDRGRSLK